MWFAAAVLMPATMSALTLRGTATDAASGEPLVGCSAVLTPGKAAVIADIDGHYSVNVAPGTYTIKASYVGFQSWSRKVTLIADAVIDIEMHEQAETLAEVTVTARESTGNTSASRIGRDAMRHIQPSSFTDLLSLLPGGMSSTPSMTSTNSIRLRETGVIGATGSSVRNPDYDITSLGTLFVVDGAPISTDANMQSIGKSDDSRGVTNRGVDMRSISTDNIESVEIVRGIPSAEYGNLTSGLVNIRRTRRATPLTARFKADGYSKLFFVGKGVGIGGNALNFDFGWLDSKADPRDNLTSYTRINGSARALLGFAGRKYMADWNLGVDYTGTLDDVKEDPDLSYRRVDEYSSRYNRVSASSDLSFTFPYIKWLNKVSMIVSASYQHDRLERHRDVAPARAAIAPTSMEEGEHDGRYLLTQYRADYLCDGKPLSLFAKLRASGSYGMGALSHDYKIGAEWNMAKNYGRGQVYDIEKPLSAAWTTRPRAYNEIPAIHSLAFYIEDNATIHGPLGGFELQAGLRTSQMPHLDSRYDIAGRVWLDPRFNAQWTLPLRSRLGIQLSAGWGLTTRMPTTDYLFPQVSYADFVEMSYYDRLKPHDNSRVILRTYIDDPVNYNLQPARNSKWEFRLGASLGANRLSITYFNERLRSGFRYTSVYAPYEYRHYDTSTIESSSLQGPPSTEGLAYTDERVLSGYRQATNGSRIDKQGIEFQITTARWRPLATALTVTGAWFRSQYSNSQLLQIPLSLVIGGEALANKYIGVYDTNEGRINNRFNTNFLFDTQIPRLGLVFSTTIECLWLTSTKSLAENGRPVSYISVVDGLEHPFTDEAIAADPLLAQLIYSTSPDARLTTPPAIYVNLKASKRVGRYLNVALFVNRILDYLPDYKSNGLTIRRSADAYFGMELNFTL